jgi:hypothetical protein
VPPFETFDTEELSGDLVLLSTSIYDSSLATGFKLSELERVGWNFLFKGLTNHPPFTFAGPLVDVSCFTRLVVYEDSVFVVKGRGSVKKDH